MPMPGIIIFFYIFAYVWRNSGHRHNLRYKNIQHVTFLLLILLVCRSWPKPIKTRDDTNFFAAEHVFLVKVLIFKIASARKFARPAVYFHIFWSMFNKRRLFIPVSDILFQYYSQAFCQQKPWHWIASICFTSLYTVYD